MSDSSCSSREHGAGRALRGRDDARIVCRRLWPGDRAAVRDHVLRLDPETRASRFLAAITDAAALAYAERVLVAEGIAVGIFVDGTLRGLGELRRAGPRRFGLPLGRQAEAAFTVERTFRRGGLGSALFRRIVQVARGHGVAELQVRCLDGNGPMRRLALRNGAALAPHGGETEGAIRLARPTPLALWSEGVAASLDLALAVTASPCRGRRAA